LIAGGNGRLIYMNDPQIKLVRLWDAATGREQATLAHEGTVDCLAFSPDGKKLATGADMSEGRAIRLWDVVQAKESATQIKFSGFVAALAFSPDGKILAGGVDDGEPCIKLWDAATGKGLATWKAVQLPLAPENWAGSLVFFPDGKTLAAGYRDGTVRF